jgi:hypothetical protein
MTDSLAAHSTYHYKLKCDSKNAGGDTFETRILTSASKTDATNPLYGL